MRKEAKPVQQRLVNKRARIKKSKMIGPTVYPFYLSMVKCPIELNRAPLSAHKHSRTLCRASRKSRRRKLERARESSRRGRSEPRRRDSSRREVESAAANYCDGFLLRSPPPLSLHVELREQRDAAPGPVVLGFVAQDPDV